MDRSDFEEQIVRTIPKAENISEHENQSNQSDAINNTTSDTVRAIKAIKATQSTIRPERYEQSDMVSDTIRMNPGVVTSLVALRRKSETRAEA